MDADEIAGYRMQADANRDRHAFTGRQVLALLDEIERLDNLRWAEANSRRVAEAERDGVRQRLVDVQAEVAKREETQDTIRERLTAERDEARAAIERVRKLHVDAGPSQGFGSDFEDGYGEYATSCSSCGWHGENAEPWPCPTIRALDGDTAGGEPT